MSQPKAMSVSRANTYFECARKYKHQEIDGIVPEYSPSYFKFGSVVDAGCNVLLNGGSDALAKSTVDKELDKLKSEKTQYFEFDWDTELISEEVRADVLKQAQSFGYPGDNVDLLVAKLFAKPFKELSENQRKALGCAVIESLRVKAHLMLVAYKANVMPLLTDVKGVQKFLSWTDDKGNKFSGVIDYQASMSGHGPVLPDNKTSNNPERDFGPDSVRTSFQLAVYTGVERTPKAAYIVMGKKIRKNKIKKCEKCGYISQGSHKTCDNVVLVPDPNPVSNFKTEERCHGEWIVTIAPEAVITIVVDEVPAEEQRFAQEVLTGVAEAVKAGAFPMNPNACRKKFGANVGYCEYLNLCRNGSMDGLERKKK